MHSAPLDAPAEQHLHVTRYRHHHCRVTSPSLPRSKVGVCALIVALPGFPLLDAIGKETFELPDGHVAAWLVLNGASCPHPAK